MTVTAPARQPKEPRPKAAISEAEQVEQWRVHEALEITGCTLKQAIAFAASDGDLHKLADLVKAGCPGATALRIA